MKILDLKSTSLIFSFILFFSVTSSLISYGKGRNVPVKENNFVFVNPSHLDHLYEEIKINDKRMAIIHIYSDYPDYEWVEAKGEGIACIDDATRALVFYSSYFQATGDKTYLQKAKKLVEFILHMQSESGWFYNFLQSDHLINKTYKTSLAQPDWWTWRALWSLTEAYKLFQEKDRHLSNRILSSLEKTFDEIKKELPALKVTKVINGFERPTWLPFETGADQTSILVMALVNYCEIKNDSVLKKYLVDLCDGIIKMQEGNETEFPYNAFMSWENIWHAYGNSQSYALLKTYQLTKNEKLKTKALSEINNFYRYILKENFLNYFSLKKDDGGISVDELEQFSQIAYGIRPMIYASLEGFKITKDKSYAELAGNIAAWFFGNNPSSKQMYDPKTGMCYDGINNKSEINLNSGAESTIEALMSLLAIEQNPTALSVLKKYIGNR